MIDVSDEATLEATRLFLLGNVPACHMLNEKRRKIEFQSLSIKKGKSNGIV